MPKTFHTPTDSSGADSTRIYFQRLAGVNYLYFLFFCPMLDLKYGRIMIQYAI